MSIKEYAGYALYSLFAKKLPSSEGIGGKIYKKFRVLFARMYDKDIDKSANIDRNVTFCKRLKLGKESGIGRNSLVQGSVVIGNYVMMGPECFIFTTNHEFSDLNIPMINQGFSKENKVIIEDNVWIGGRVTILPGVTIHEGAIIGAGAVVTKDVSKNSIVGGNPAQILKYRE